MGHSGVALSVIPFSNARGRGLTSAKLQALPQREYAQRYADDDVASGSSSKGYFGGVRR